MYNDKVSIIIPVYNTGRYLKQCIDSVISQTHRNLQIILVNDGSTDHSPAICEDYRKRDSRIQVIHKENEGLGPTRNAGLKLVEGTYVTFLDSDDWISPDHIEHLLKEIKDVKADVVIGSNIKCRNDGTVIEKTELPYHGIYEGSDIKQKIMLSIIAADDSSRRDLGIPMSVCFSLYLFSVIKENEILFGSEREYVSEDLFFNLEFFSFARRVSLSHETGYHYRYNPVSITREFNEKQIQRTDCFYRRLNAEVKELGIADIAELRVKRCMIAKLRGLLLMIVRSGTTPGYKIKKMSEILESDTARSVLKGYPLANYRFSLKITTLLMKLKMIHVLYLVLSLKERMR